MTVVGPQVPQKIFAARVTMRIPERKGLAVSQPPGAAFLTLGFGVMMWAWWLFRQGGTPIRPTDRATKLVTTGPFRFSRNPMYLGIVGMLLGVAVWVGSAALLIAPAAFLLLMSRVFIPFEEARLREAFPDVYPTYTNKVRRWL